MSASAANGKAATPPPPQQPQAAATNQTAGQQPQQQPPAANSYNNYGYPPAKPGGAPGSGYYPPNQQQTPTLNSLLSNQAPNAPPQRPNYPQGQNYYNNENYNNYRQANVSQISSLFLLKSSQLFGFCPVKFIFAFLSINERIECEFCECVKLRNQQYLVGTSLARIRPICKVIVAICNKFHANDKN